MYLSVYFVSPCRTCRYRNIQIYLSKPSAWGNFCSLKVPTEDRAFLVLCPWGENKEGKFSASQHKHVQSFSWEDEWLTWGMYLEEVVELVKLGLCWFFFQARLYPGCTSSFSPLEAACSPAQPRAEGQVCLIQALGVGKSLGLYLYDMFFSPKTSWLWYLISFVFTSWGSFIVLSSKKCRILKHSSFLKQFLNIKFWLKRAPFFSLLPFSGCLFYVRHCSVFYLS